MNKRKQNLKYAKAQKQNWHKVENAIQAETCIIEIELISDENLNKKKEANMKAIKKVSKSDVGKWVVNIKDQRKYHIWYYEDEKINLICQTGIRGLNIGAGELKENFVWLN